MRTYHIYPSVPSVITVNGINCGVTSTTIQCEDDDHFSVTVMPTVENRLPFAFVVNQSLELPSNVRVVELPKGHFDLIADAPRSSAVKQRLPILLGDDRLTATVFCNGELWLDKLVLRVPPDCGEIQCQTPLIDGSRYIELSGGNYLAIIDNEYNLCGEFYAEKITRKGREIECQKLFNDLAGRAHVDLYALEGGKARQKQSYDIYVGGLPSRPTDTALYPLAFLQAMLAGDIDEARYYLSVELNETLSDEDLRSFFNYTDIYPCSYYSDNQVVLTDGKTARLFQIQCEGGSIENIEEL